MTQTTITIRDGQAWVDMPSPRVGNRLTADQSAALHALTSLAAEGIQVHYDGNPLATLAADLLDPSRWGYAVTREVRAAARLALGIPAIKTTTPLIYLSGPMTGLPQFNFPAFNEEADKLRDMGFHVVNPAELNPEPHAGGWHGLQCMGGHTFYAKVYKPTRQDRLQWVESAIRYRKKSPTEAAQEAGLTLGDAQ